MSLLKILAKCSKETDHTVCACKIDSPVGKIIAVADDDFLYIVNFEDAKNLEKKLQAVTDELSCKFAEEKNKLLLKFEQEVNYYFEGKLKKFTIPIKTLGSEFQRVIKMFHDLGSMAKSSTTSLRLYTGLWRPRKGRKVWLIEHEKKHA